MAEQKTALAGIWTFLRLHEPSGSQSKTDALERTFDPQWYRSKHLGSKTTLMHDYSQLGQEKLRQQTSRGLDEIRCPLDSAIMMVIGGTAYKKEDGKTVYREFTGHPRKSAWTIVTVHLECSACRRRIADVSVDRAAVDTGSPTFQPVLS